MKELENKKTTIFLFVLATIICLYYMFNYWSDGIYSGFHSNVGLQVFYQFQNFVPTFLLLGLLSNCLVIDNFYQNKQT